MENKLIIRKGTYGVSERRVISLDYENGGMMPFFEEYELGQYAMDLLDRIFYAIENGFEIKFENTRGEDEA